MTMTTVTNPTAELAAAAYTAGTLLTAALAAASSPVGAFCPSVCPSDWDKQKTPAVSCSKTTSYVGREKSKRRGQDSLEACLLLVPDRSNTLLCNAL